MESSAELQIGEAIRRFVAVDDPGATLSVLLKALDDLPVGIGLLKLPDLRFVYANNLYESWYQADRRPLAGRRLEDALYAAPQVLAIFRDVARVGKPAHSHNAEFTGLKGRPFVLPGDVTMWDWSIWPLKDGGGNVTHLLVSGYDVTAPALDRMNAELAHEEGVRALLEVSRVAGSSGPIEAFFGELSARVARVVGAGKVLFTTVHNGVMRLQPSSYGFDDGVLRDVTVPCSPHGNDLASRIVYHDHVLRSTIDTGPEFEPYRSVLGVMDVRNTVAVCWRVGDLRLGLVAAFNSTSPDGFSDRDAYLLKTASMAAGLVWQHRQDEARVAQAQEQERSRLKAAADEMGALERAKADFLRMASHEMRGPINVISVYAGTLAEGSAHAGSPAVREAAAAINDKVHELNRMVDQVLEVSRLEDPNLRLNLRTFDLRDVAARARDEVAALARGRNVTLVLPREHVPVHGDPERLQMVLQNLLDNALKYSPAGGDVGCAVRRQGDDAEVLITDHGIGIAHEDLPKLFARFSRVGGERAQGIPGTGLGLYLSRETARLLGGDLTAQSQPGKGSVFRLTLPALPAQPDAE